MAAERTVIWSAQADAQVDRNIAFLRMQWTEREVAAFLDLLEEFEHSVKKFPNGYAPAHLYPGCRRAVIHRNVSVVYKVSETIIEVVTVYDNRSARSQQ